MEAPPSGSKLSEGGVSYLEGLLPSSTDEMSAQGNSPKTVWIECLVAANIRYRVADMAKMLKVSQTQAQRLVDLTKDGAGMEAIDDAMDLLGLAFVLPTEVRHAELF